MEVCQHFGPTGNSSPPTLVNDDSEEVARMMNQAQLGHLSKRLLLMRCQSMTADSCGGGPPMTRLPDLYPEPVLQKHEEGRVAKIRNVVILPGQKEKRHGTIEAHVNGFTYSDHRWDEATVIMHDNVERCFYGLENCMHPPLMQFHLKQPIKIRNTKTKDIQFRLAPTRFSSSSRDEDLRNFIHKVQETQRICESELRFTPIDFQALDEFQFDAADLPTGAPTRCSLTRSAMVVLLKESPYLVVRLLEIQFVNLACFGDGIEMTVVFADMKRDVFQLGSIPLGYLTGIKDRLNRENVKYYVNSLRPNWSEGVRLNRDLPDVFLADGGWDFLEDSLTLANYPPLDLEEDFDSAYKEAENIWKIVRASKSKRARWDPETDELVVY